MATVSEDSALMMAGYRSNRTIRLKNNWSYYLYILPVILFALVFFYYPIVYSANISTLDWNGVSVNRTFVGLENYQNILSKDPIFVKALRNQVVYGIAVITIQMILGLTMAVLLKSRARLKTLYKVVFFLPVVLSSTVAAYVFRQIYDGRTGQLNQVLTAIGLDSLTHPWLADPQTALFGLMLITIWQYTGFSFMMYYAGLTQIDEELYEAARIDGATFFQIITRIVIPLLRPTHFTLIILGIISVLKTFDVVYLTTQGGPARATEFMSTYIFKRGLLDFDAGYASALAFFLLGIAFVLTVIQLWSYRRNRGA